MAYIPLYARSLSRRLLDREEDEAESKPLQEFEAKSQMLQGSVAPTITPPTMGERLQDPTAPPPTIAPPLLSTPGTRPIAGTPGKIYGVDDQYVGAPRTKSPYFPKVNQDLERIGIPRRDYNAPMSVPGQRAARGETGPDYAMQQYLQGATFGGSDYLGAAFDELTGTGEDGVRRFQLSDVPFKRDNVLDRVGERKKERADWAEENLAESLTAEGMGLFTPGGVASGLTKLGGKAANIALKQTPGTFSKYLKNVFGAGAEGALYGAGTANPEKIMENMVSEGGITALFGAVQPVLKKTLQIASVPLKAALKGFAGMLSGATDADEAIKLLASMPQVRRAVMVRGDETAKEIEEKIREKIRLNEGTLADLAGDEGGGDIPATLQRLTGADVGNVVGTNIKNMTAPEKIVQRTGEALTENVSKYDAKAWKAATEANKIRSGNAYRRIFRENPDPKSSQQLREVQENIARSPDSFQAPIAKKAYANVVKLLKGKNFNSYVDLIDGRAVGEIPEDLLKEYDDNFKALRKSMIDRPGLFDTKLVFGRTIGGDTQLSRLGGATLEELDLVKRQLDKELRLGKYTNKETGELTTEGLALRGFVKEFTDAIDNTFEGYALVRQNYNAYIKSRKMKDLGTNIFAAKKTEDEVLSQLQEAIEAAGEESEMVRDGFLAGVREAIAGKINASAGIEFGDQVAAIIQPDNKINKILKAVLDADKYDNYIRSLRDEAQAVRTAGIARQAGKAEISPDMGSDVATAVAFSAVGRHDLAAGRMFGKFQKSLEAGEVPEPLKVAMAKVLTDSDPENLQKLARVMANQGTSLFELADALGVTSLGYNVIPRISMMFGETPYDDQ